MEIYLLENDENGGQNMNYTRKIYNLSLILLITLIFGILIGQAKKVPISPLTQLSAISGASQDTVVNKNVKAGT